MDFVCAFAACAGFYRSCAYLNAYLCAMACFLRNSFSVRNPFGSPWLRMFRFFFVSFFEMADFYFFGNVSRMRACVHAFVRACLQACVSVRLRACARTWFRVPFYLYASMRPPLFVMKWSFASSSLRAVPGQCGCGCSQQTQNLNTFFENKWFQSKTQSCSRNLSIRYGNERS